MEQASIDSRIKMLERKLKAGDLKPKLQGITKPTPRVDPKVNGAPADKVKETTYLQDLQVMEDVYEYIDYYAVTDGSLDSVLVLTSVGAVRYFDHMGLFDSAQAAEFYTAANTFFAYLAIKHDLVPPPDLPVQTMDTGANIFDDEQRAQMQRAVYQDTDLTALFTAYFSDLGTFVTAVKNGDWRGAGAAIRSFGPDLANIAFSFLALPGG